MKKTKPYSSLALVYSHLMRRIRYDKWADYLYELVKEEIPSNAKVLELAAGNCVFAEHFKKHYKNIIVTDLSKDFMKAAETTQVKVCCDMTSLPFKNKFRLVYSNFDSINYLLTTEQLKKLFSEVYRILDEKSIFTFDVSLENNSYRHEKEILTSQRVKGIKYTHLSKYNPRTMIHTNKFIVHSLKGETYSEIHKQKIYPFHKYFEIIPQSGLYISQCYETFTFKEGNPGSERIQFILKKNQNASV